MNKQGEKGIEWTRIREADGTVRPGYTWNPVGGCFHDCKWQMPDGSVAECYAKTVAEGLARAAYPDGFESHYYHPDRLYDPVRLKEPAGIFLDSMADLMGHWVKDRQILEVMQMVEMADWHIFQLLTKNAPRLLEFSFPRNVWLGVSSPPDWMWGKRLSRGQQEAMLRRSLTILEAKANLANNVTWMSFEPLSWPVAAIVKDYPGSIQWAVIGAASNGRKQYPPDERHLKSLLNVLDGWGVPVFFKGNLRSLDWARDHWREGFPGGGSVYETRTETRPETRPGGDVEQLSLF